MANQYDYYYGNETEQFRFYQIPKDLIDSPRFLKLSIDAKVLYSVLRDRMQLSRENGWIDEEKRVFLIFKIEEIAKMMGVCVEKSVKLLKDLVSFGLVEKVRRGQGLASIIYVRNFAAPIGDETEPEESTDEDQIALENPSQNPINALNSEKPNSRIRKNRKQEFGKSEL